MNSEHSSPPRIIVDYSSTPKQLQRSDQPPVRNGNGTCANVDIYQIGPPNGDSGFTGYNGSSTSHSNGVGWGGALLITTLLFRYQATSSSRMNLNSVMAAVVAIL